MSRSQEAQDHETFEANTHAAENRRANLHRRARVDSIRNSYRSRTHFRYARPRVCPPNSVLVAGRYFTNSNANDSQRPLQAPSPSPAPFHDPTFPASFDGPVCRPNRSTGWADRPEIGLRSFRIPAQLHV